MPTVYDQIELKIKEMYELDEALITECTELVENMLKMCVIDSKQDLDKGDLDLETSKLVAHFVEIEEHLKPEEISEE